MDEIKISVIIPVFNCEGTIQKCVESLSPVGKNYLEILLVDDGSTDNSLNVCLKLRDQYKNIVLISKLNGGVSSARNEGIKKASGEWILFLDADDYLEKNSMEILLPYISNPNTELLHFGAVNDFYLSDKISLIGQKKRQIPLFEKISREYIDRNYEQSFVELFRNDVYDAVWGKCYRKSVIDKYNILFLEEMQVREDSEFVLQYITHTSTVRLLNAYLYHYRIVGEENTYYSRREIRLEDIKKLEERYKIVLDTKNISNDEINNMVNRQLFMLICGGIMRMSSKLYKYKISELYHYINLIGNMFETLIIKLNYKMGFYRVLVFLLKHRMYLFSSVLCKIRFYNAF